MIPSPAPVAIRWLLPASLLVAFAGYFLPWISHPASGLNITGVDFGEYVKFLPAVLSGEVDVWREAYYLPIIALTLTAAISAYRHEYSYRSPFRVLLLVIALAATANLLPPAWTPGRLLLPEFRQQLVALALGCILVACSPIVGRLPVRIYQLIVLATCAISIILPVVEFADILPLLRDLYRQPVAIGPGPYLVVGALICCCVAAVLSGRRSLAANPVQMRITIGPTP